MKRKKKKDSLYKLLYNYFDNSYLNSRKTISIAELMIHFRSYPSLSKRNEFNAVKILKIMMYQVRRAFLQRKIFIIPMVVKNKIYAYRIADYKRENDKILAEEHVQDHHEQFKAKGECLKEIVSVAVETKLLPKSKRKQYLLPL